MEAPAERLLLRSDTALGHGNIEGVRHVVYIRPDTFNSLNNRTLAAEIEKINRTFTERGDGYVLIGPGRWGSSDPALGVPVKWPAISSARLIVETAFDGYNIDTSQGTHFFHNLTSMGVGYFTVGPEGKGNGICDYAWLDACPATYRSDSVRIVEFDTPLEIGLNGLKGIGVVLKPAGTNP